jgi:transposase
MPKEPSRADSNPSKPLPDNLDDCHSFIKQLLERVAELEKQLSRRNRAAFGKKSAKVDASQLTGTGKVVHNQTTAELDEEKDRLNIVPDTNKGGGRSEPPESISTRRIEHWAEASEIPCPCCGNAREIVGFDVSYQLEFVKALYENLEHVTFNYSCKKCQAQMFTTEKPCQPIDKGKAGPGLLAKIATDKVWLHLPLYRQEQVFKALSLPVNRASMCRWLKEVALIFAPIVEKMKKNVLKSRVVQTDATTMPVIKKGLGKTHRAFIWTYRGDADHADVFYD